MTTANTPAVPRTPRRAGLAALALALGVLSPALVAAPAWAHDSLRSTNPADGTTVESAPDAVDLVMSSTPLGLGTQVEVTGPDGLVATVGAGVSSSVGRLLAGSRHVRLGRPAAVRPLAVAELRRRRVPIALAAAGALVLAVVLRRARR